MSHYRGVRWRRFKKHRYETTGPGKMKIRYWNVIDLPHTDATKRIPLAVGMTGVANNETIKEIWSMSANPENPYDAQPKVNPDNVHEAFDQLQRGRFDQIWTSYSDILGLPALDERPNAPMR